MDTEKRKIIIKKKLKALGIKGRPNSINLTCKGCGNIDSINTNNPNIYTEEVKKNYLCWKCKPPTSKKREAKIQPKEREIPMAKEEKKDTPVVVEEKVATPESITMKLEIRKDGVLRIASRFIEKYGFIGGSNCKLDISLGKIIITKE